VGLNPTSRSKDRKKEKTMGDMADWITDQEDFEFIEEEPYRLLGYIKIIEERPLAWLFEMKDHKREWFPKSECDIDERHKEIQVPTWLVEKKRLVNKEKLIDSGHWEDKDEEQINGHHEDIDHAF